MGAMKYSTNQRELILRFLKEFKAEHITVDDVQYHLKSNGDAVGKATIYRYFDLLVEEGKLRKYTGLDGKSACYQYVDEDTGCHEHYHLICDNCDELFHIECDYLDSMNHHILEDHHFQINSFKTVLHGLCQKCAAQI